MCSYDLLATANKNAEPYATPLSYVYLNNCIYFHCADSGHKIENIKENPLCSITVIGGTKPLYTNNFTTYYESVIVFGEASLLIEEMKKIEEEKLQESLTRRSREITTQGSKIAEHMDIRDMKLYRSMISEFLGEVVANSHKFSRDNYLDRRGRHRVYGIVRLVNQKVDELAR